MLYVFYGSDVEQARKKAHALIDSLRTKRPDAAFESINPDNWNLSILESHLGGQGLFSSKYIIFLDRVSEKEEAKEIILDFIPAMNESSNIFIALEGKLSAELKKAVEKGAEKAVECEKNDNAGSAGKNQKKEFNVFVLSDAIGEKNAFKSWALYRQGIENGLEAENILGTIFWQVKSLILAAKSKTAAEAGLNPFVFSKSKKYASNYSEEKLRVFLAKLIEIYHDGHRGGLDMDLKIEQLLLSL